MRVCGHGVDVVNVPRFARVLERHGQRFLDRCFTPAEQKYCSGKARRTPEHFAGRFAAKEAIVKALGTGFSHGVSWTDIEVTNGPTGEPKVALSGHAARVAGELGIREWLLSISHTEEVAMASAIGQGA